MAYIPTQQQLAGSQAPASGITTKFNSDERVVPETKRPDGTTRKERKIRPGFTPPEDVSKFRTARQMDADSRQPPPGSVIGMGARSGVQSSTISSSASAASRKNAKRKEKRQAAATVADKLEEAPDDWEAEDGSEEPAVQLDGPMANANEGDVGKRVKALEKKLRQAEALKERSEKGEKLLPEQTEKISSMKALEAEIAGLSMSPKVET